MFKHRPWKAGLAVVVLTIGVAWFSLTIIQAGEFDSRRFGIISWAEDPMLFGLALVGNWLIVAVGWFAVLTEWNTNYLLPLKPEFEDPERSRSM